MNSEILSTEGWFFRSWPSQHSFFQSMIRNNASTRDNHLQFSPSMPGIFIVLLLLFHLVISRNSNSLQWKKYLKSRKLKDCLREINKVYLYLHSKANMINRYESVIPLQYIYFKYSILINVYF